MELDEASREAWPRGVSADAGSGKTHELMESLAALLRRRGEEERQASKRLHVDQVACITFTRNAAGELWSRAYLRLRQEQARAEAEGRDAAYWADQIARLPGAAFCTLHSLANLIVQQAPLEAGGGARNEFLDEEASKELMAQAADREMNLLDREGGLARLLFRFGIRSSAFQKGLPGLLADFAFRALADGLSRDDLHAKAKDSFRPCDDGDGPSEAEWNEFGRVFMDAIAGTMDRYAKLRGQRLDFAEALVLARNLLRDRHFRERILDRFRFVFLDEAQDTDPVQLEVLFWLSGATAEDAPFGDRLVMVGDDKQAIYRWRSAEPRLFRQALDQFKERGALYELRANWRALPRLAAAYQALGDMCRDPHSLASGKPPAPDPSPCRRLLEPAEVAPVVEQMRRGPAILRLKSEAYALELSGGGRMPAATARLAEARAVAAFIHGLVSGKLAPPEGLAVYEDDPAAKSSAGKVQRPVTAGGRPLFRYRDFMALSRQKEFLAILDQALRKLGVPCILADRQGLWQRPEVLDAVAPFRALLRPDDTEALVSLLRGPVFACSDEDLAKWLSAKERVCLAELAAGRQRWARDCRKGRESLVSLLDDLSTGLSKRRPARLLDEWVDRSGLKALYASLPDGAAALANLGRLREVWQERFAAGEGLEELVDRAERGLAGEVADEEGAVYGDSSDAVRLMTVHKAKGLQAPIVIVANMGSAVRDRTGWDGAEYTRDRGIVAKMPLDQGERVDSQGMALHKAAENHNMDPPLTNNDYGASLRDGALFEDERRLFYVALTRARDALVLSSDMVLGGNRTKNLEGLPCWANWARWLELSDPGRFAVKDWDAAELASRAADWDSAPETPAFVVPPETMETRALERWPGRRVRFAPAKREAVGKADPLDGEAPKSGDAEAEAAAKRRENRVNLGVMLHDYLAAADLGSGEVDRGILARAACSHGFDPRGQDVADAERDLARLLADARFRRMLGGAERLMREQAFLHVPPGAAEGLRGAIDLVVVRDSRRKAAEVVDYKYSQPGQGEDHQGYHAQVKAYAAALEAAGWKVTAASLLYFRGQVTWVDVVGETPP